MSARQHAPVPSPASPTPYGKRGSYEAGRPRDGGFSRPRGPARSGEPENRGRELNPPFARELLASPGVPLDRATRSSMEAAFCYDFSRIRVHADSRAADSARVLHAHAYSAGSHLVFARGRYAPATYAGKRLLAHELTHAVQQDRSGAGTLEVGDPNGEAEREANRAAERVGRGQPAGRVGAEPRAFFHLASDFVGFIKHFFGQFRTFDVVELQAYLSFIDRGRIEGEMDSDDKAVQIVRAWRTGGSPYVLNGLRRAVIIKELLDGPTTASDEEAILEILERSDPAVLDEIFFVFGSPSAKQIAEDVPDGPESQLADFCRRRWVGGIDHFRKGYGEPRAAGKPIPLGAPLPKPQPGPPLEMPQVKTIKVPPPPLFGGPLTSPQSQATPAPASRPFGREAPYPGTATDVLRAVLSSPFGERLKDIAKNEVKSAWTKSELGEKIFFFAGQLAPLSIGVYGIFGGMTDNQRRELWSVIANDRDNELLRPLPEKTLTLLELLLDPAFKIRVVRPPVGEIDVH